MTEKLDLRGLICPEPVIRTKKIFDDPKVNAVEAMVDDEVCVSNLQRLSRSLKTGFSATAQDGYFTVVMSKDALTQESAKETSAKSELESKGQQARAEQQTVVFITRDKLGDGEPDFSRTLLDVFLQTMFEAGHRPQAILLANSGVKLMAADSSALKVLEDFRSAGTEVLACGLCVKFYALEDQVRKEQITNMFAICEYVNAASKVITP